MLVVATVFSPQAPIHHLLAASFLSAPAALGVSKLFWPDDAPRDDDDEDFPDTEQEEYVVIYLFYILVV